MFAQTPVPPYYAVIFTSTLNSDSTGYEAMAERMIRLAQKQSGFLGLESVRHGIGITISYWRDAESIHRWRQHIEHREAQTLGKNRWYDGYRVRICKVERAYEFQTG